MTNPSDPDDTDDTAPVSSKTLWDPLAARPVVRPDDIAHRRQHPLTAADAPPWFEDWRGGLGDPKKWEALATLNSHYDDTTTSVTSWVMILFLVAVASVLIALIILGIGFYFD